MLKYTYITQNTYIQSWTVTEIMAREKFGLLAVPRMYLLSLRVPRALRMSVLDSGMHSQREQLVTCKELQKCPLHGHRGRQILHLLIITSGATWRR